jgi:hypothetical protein
MSTYLIYSVMYSTIYTAAITDLTIVTVITVIVRLPIVAVVWLCLLRCTVLQPVQVGNTVLTEQH